jgi:hypothetical protein
MAFVDLSGNLGGVSQYNRLKYGLGHYSRIDAFAPVFAAVALDIVGIDEFAGNFAPIVSFAGALVLTEGLAGDLAPTVTFGDADLGLQVDLAGDMASQIDLEGLLGLDLFVQGGLPFQIDFGASGLISGPLWSEVDKGEPPWVPSESCPPSVWTPVGPCDPVEWDDAELCNG